MNVKSVWYTALHEMRSQRRLVRTHVFIGIALTLCVLYYSVVSLTHMQSANEIPMLGIISPRYIMSLLSGSFVALFCVGVLVLTFDLVRRDEINRIQEVISTKPVRNFEFLTGRLLGVMMTMSIPMIFVLVVIVVYGVIAETFSLSFGQPVILWGVVSFIVLDIVPNFAFFGSMAIFLTALCKSRLVAIVFTVFGLATLFWLNSRLPLDISAPVQTVTGNVIFTSELSPIFLTPTIVVNRTALLLLSIGFLYYASSLDKRINPARFGDLAVGCTSVLLGIVVLWAMIGVHTQSLRQIDEWVRVHDEHFIPSAFPDVQEIRGRINIEPSRSLSLDLTLEVKADTNQESDFVIFSLNPGYQISSLRVAGVHVTDHVFEHGLLKIPSRYFPASTSALELTAQGRPDKRFAYLDSIDTIAQIEGPEIRQLRLLGTESSIFHPDFVVLVPGIKWYPTSGTATNEDVWEQREKDFFTIDIVVSAPKRWLVAGPAKRQTMEEYDRKTFRFVQSSPISEIALVGSKFESASTEVEGIEFEVLYSPVHRKTFNAIAIAEDNIRERLQRTIEDIHELGLNYTYGTYSLVSVPSTLRIYGGGKDLDTVMCPPGLLMIRESTLPTYPNASQFNREPLEQTDETEQDWISSHFSRVFSYLQSHLFESSTNYVFYRNLLVQQTSATQEGARAVNTLLSLLSEAVFPIWRADFDFQLTLNRDILNLTSLNPIHFLGSSRQRRMFSEDVEMMRKTHATRTAPEVWDMVGSVGTFDSDLQATSTLKLRALRFRTQRVVQLLRDALGTDKLAPIIVDLTNRFRGKNFLYEEFVSVFSDHGFNLEELAGDLIGKAGLPGFIATNPTSSQTSESDQPTYESSLVLQNDQPVSGPVRLSIAYQSEDPYVGRMNAVSLPPMLVQANQALRVVIESSKPVQHIWVHPYLSLNRKQFRVDLPLTDDSQNQEQNTDVAPFIKATEIIEVKHRSNSSITIDDLDPEFSVIDHRDTSVLSSAFTEFSRRLLGTKEVPVDNGLPVYQFSFGGQPIAWSRKSDPTAYGTYRRTFVLATGSTRPASAKFSATLPHLGKWKLEYYLPDKNLVEEIQLGGMFSTSLMISQQVSTIQLEIINGSTNTSHSIDASNLSKGWHTVGNFDLSDTVVDVLISNKTDRMYYSVFADAIRWTPIKTAD